MKQIVVKCLQLQAQLRVLHWQTTSYAEHNAFGGTYASLDEKLDALIEVTQGKYGRISLGGLESIVVSDYANLKINVFLIDMVTFFEKGIWDCGVQKDTHIANIVDEIRADLDKLKYLLTLK